MTDLLLVSANRERSPYPVFPIGAWTLKRYLDRCGLETDVLDLNLANGLEDLDTRLETNPPGVVGLSIRNIDNLSWPDSISYLPDLRRIVERIRARIPADRIVLGGGGFSIFGQTLLDALDLPHGIVGDGETALARRLGVAGDLPEPDFSYAPAVPTDILRAYDVSSGMLGIQTRRGCPFDCSYCTYPAIEGTRHRLRPIESVIDELEFLSSRIGARVFYFVDSLVNAPVPYTRDLFEAIARSPLRIRWYGFADPAHLDDETAAVMARSGCVGLEIGAEAGHPDTLESLGKRFGPEHILEASNVCRRHRIKFCHYLMLGAPNETPQTVRASLDLMKECAPSTVIASIGIRLYPGTPLAQRPDILASQLPPQTWLDPPVFHRPAQIDLPQIAALCKEYALPRWIFPGSGTGMDLDLMDSLRRRGLRGPLWDYL